MNNYYFSEIEKIPLLTLEQEKEIAAKAFNGDKAAQKKLVEHNLRFVVKIANQYKDYMDMDDLVNEGNMGLMHAAEKYNPDNGNKFSTYAVWWIKAYIQKAIRETSTGVKFPATKYQDMKLAKWNFASLDKTISGTDGEESTFGSFIKDDRFKSPEDEYWEKEAINNLNDGIQFLRPLEQTVLIKRFGLDGEEPMSLSEIGSFMGFSKERIRQIEKKAIVQLRKNITSNGDSSYDGYAA